MRTHARRLVLALALASAPALSGCGRTVTAAELVQCSWRSCPNRAPPDVARAVRVALRTMGYTVVDDTGARLKTAPKVILVAAYGSRHSAVAVDRSLAWVIDISAENGGAAVHAEMRPSQGGRALRPRT